ncbi:hypothetical protein [Hymenobacter rubripertinctus]|uniref:Outer membrane protein beta-barrel domain-containing protein n=1 Tax=Hymenobacter rubripertinctus TaxID=2029981 RepID=A0A418QR57_9BACT|nr:hypothetical protein [Hymenobacter rubripertinctus]RIY07603.1 hypothetical protein D0T11_16110 [Hymenobacter rubripertinctus]
MNTFFSLRAGLALAGGAAVLFSASCTAPRAIVSTGKVTPRGEFRVGGNVSLNLPTETIGRAGATLKSAAQDLADKAARDTVNYNQTVENLQVAAIAYALDPVRPSSDLYVRYGVVERFDVGYKYAFGSHVFDAMYQFLGPTGTPENPGSREAGVTYGSIGLQYATQRSKLPSIPFLDDVNSLLGFRATRHDLIVPLVFSKSLGPEEEIGAISYGVVYAHSFLRYGLTPGQLYNGPGSGFVPGSKVPDLPTTRRNFSSFGAFFNAKLGYRYAYVIPALSVYYQNYGEYQLLNNKTAKLSGFTFIPSLGLQFRIPSTRR